MLGVVHESLAQMSIQNSAQVLLVAVRQSACVIIFWLLLISACISCTLGILQVALNGVRMLGRWFIFITCARSWDIYNQVPGATNLFPLVISLAHVLNG